MTRRVLGAALAVGAVVATVVLSACGQGSAGSGSGSPSTGSSAPTSPPTGSATRLTVTATVGDGSPSRTYTLTCDPTGGSHPRALQACAELAALTAKGEDPFAPTPSDLMCNQMYGGPQTATVTGTYRGRPVEASFGRTDGCAVDRWNHVAVLLVVRGTVLEHPLTTPSGG